MYLFTTMPVFLLANQLVITPKRCVLTSNSTGRPQHPISLSLSMYSYTLSLDVCISFVYIKITRAMAKFPCLADNEFADAKKKKTFERVVNENYCRFSMLPCVYVCFLWIVIWTLSTRNIITLVKYLQPFRFLFDFYWMLLLHGGSTKP